MAVFPFRQETRATLRHRVGRLMHRDRFLYGTATAGTSSTVTLAEAKPFPTDSFVGRTLTIYDGTGAGQTAGVSASALGTGVLTVSPSFATDPDATSKIEVWPDGLTPEAVNDALNLALLDLHGLWNIRVDTTSPTLDADRKVITLPASMVKLIDVRTRDSGGTWTVYRPARYPEYPREGGHKSFVLQGTSLYLSDVIPSSVADADIVVRGYRLPAEMDADDDLCEADPAYLVYMAAYYLEAADAAGQSLDPEQHSGRASNWLRQALLLRARINTKWEPGTIEVHV